MKRTKADLSLVASIVMLGIVQPVLWGLLIIIFTI
jgi:hypothetical protein